MKKIGQVFTFSALLTISHIALADTNCGGWSERQSQFESQCRGGSAQACNALRELRAARASVGCAEGQVGADGWNRSDSSGTSGTRRPDTPVPDRSGQDNRTPVQAGAGAECVSCVNTRNQFNQYAFQCRNMCTATLDVYYTNAEGRTFFEPVRPGEAKWMSYTTAPNSWRIDRVEPHD